MPDYVVVTKLTTAGAKALTSDPGRLASVNADVERMGARIKEQFRLVGPYDFITFVEAPDNETAAHIATEISSLGTMVLQVFPAVAFDRFVKLLEMEPYRTEPHRWQTQLWARTARRAGRYWVMTRHMRRLCQPLTIEGLENLRGVRGPVLIIANHTSHIDTPTRSRRCPAHCASGRPSPRRPTGSTGQASGRGGSHSSGTRIPLRAAAA